MSTLPTATWIRFTVINGYATFISYGLAAFAPLPEMLSLTLAFAFGPFFMLTSMGLFHLIQSWKDSVLLRSSYLFNVAGTTLVTLMLVVQQASFAFHHDFEAQDRGSVTGEQLQWIFREVNAVQLGIDIAWDIFISAGTILLALSAWRHPVMGRVFTITGVVSGLLLLRYNLAYFPEPPADAGSIDFGPLVALWYMALVTWILVKRKRFIRE